MISKEAVIISKDNCTIQLQHIKTSTCKNCNSCNKKNLILQNITTQKDVGETISINIESIVLLKAIFFIYFLPLLIIIIIAFTASLFFNQVLTILLTFLFIPLYFVTFVKKIDRCFINNIKVK